MIRGVWWKIGQELIICLSSSKKFDDVSISITSEDRNILHQTAAVSINPSSILMVRIEIDNSPQYLLAGITDGTKRQYLLQQDVTGDASSRIIALYSKYRGSSASDFFSMVGGVMDRITKDTISELLGIIHSV